MLGYRIDKFAGYFYLDIIASLGSIVDSQKFGSREDCVRYILRTYPEIDLHVRDK